MIAAIASVDKNFGIGYQGKMLINISEDLKYFRNVTMGSIIIMGRKTYESLPEHGLEGRLNIVITHQAKDFGIYTDGEVIFMNLDCVRSMLINRIFKTNVFIIGGSQIYKELLPFCDKIYLTRINKEFKQVDTYFPLFKKSEWKCIDEGKIEKSTLDVEYQFQLYGRL